jgi:hypothetical protein
MMTKRNDVTTKMDADVLEECRIAAPLVGLKLAEYISLRMKEAAARDIEESMAKRAAAAKAAAKPKGKG